MGLFLHQTTTARLEPRPLSCCLWVFSYIKPQPLGVDGGLHRGCLWVFSYIKPQPGLVHLVFVLSCLWVFSYIKPQQRRWVLRRKSVVYGSFPTSNHNRWDVAVFGSGLFMGLFLHQTTTYQGCERYRLGCLWVFSYIKPQLSRLSLIPVMCCLWVFSYIKPQLRSVR